MSSGLESLYPQGWYICQACVEWVKIDDLYVDKNGEKWDVCTVCVKEGKVKV